MLFVFRVVGLLLNIIGNIYFFQSWTMFTIIIKRKKHFVIEGSLLIFGIWEDLNQWCMRRVNLLYKWLKKSWAKYFAQNKWAMIFIWKLIFWSINSLCYRVTSDSLKAWPKSKCLICWKLLQVPIICRYFFRSGMVGESKKFE